MGRDRNGQTEVRMSSIINLGEETETDHDHEMISHDRILGLNLQCIKLEWDDFHRNQSVLCAEQLAYPVQK